jgi:hypothetical protein
VALKLSILLLPPLLLALCARPPAPPPATTPAAAFESTVARDLPAPVVVCVGGREGTATPSRAGVYVQGAPVDPTHLNWTVAGVGCVTYPGRAGVTRVNCGGVEARPAVERVLCQQ